MSRSSQAHTKQMAFFPPWFLEKRLLKKISGMLPDYYHKRLRCYFDSFGCIRCNRTDVIYSCGGLCLQCQWTVNNRLKKSDIEMKRRCGACDEQFPSCALLRRYQVARSLLRDFRKRV